jgi:transcriptional regulator with XRE-family HTH domain
MGCVPSSHNPDRKAKKPRVLSPNRVVGYNLQRARQRRGWSQKETVKRLVPFLRQRWSVATYSQAERSIASLRVRHFTADEIVAFAQTFDVSIGFFFMPPPEIFMNLPSLPIAAGSEAELPDYEEDRAAPTADTAELLDLILRTDDLGDRVAELLRDRPDLISALRERQTAREWLSQPLRLPEASA